MVVVLGLIALTGCGGDDGDGDDGGGGSDTTVVDDGGGGDEGDGGEEPADEGSSDDGSSGGGGEITATGVEGYCQAVLRYIELLEASIDDPEVAQELEAAAGVMTENLLALGDLSAAEQARFDECQAQAAEAANDILEG